MSEPKWKLVSKDKFHEIRDKHPDHVAHTVMICDPPITFGWKNEPKKGEDRSFGQGAFMKIIHDYEVVPNDSKKLSPKIYAWAKEAGMDTTGLEEKMKDNKYIHIDKKSYWVIEGEE
jgi:hypothetical protein